MGGGGGRGAVWAGAGRGCGQLGMHWSLKQFSKTVWGGAENVTWRIGVGRENNVQGVDAGSWA